MRTIIDIEKATGVSKIDISNWIARLNLQTPYLPAKRGTPRAYTFDNALELALIGALTNVGMRPERACGFAAVTMGVGNWERSIVIRNGDQDCVEVLPYDGAFEWRQSVTVSIINLWWIRNNLLDYFDAHATGEDD